MSNNRTINLDTLRKSGAVALIAKATEGTSFLDATYRDHRSIARAADKPFGSYLFLHPNSHGSEAEYYLDFAKPRKGEIQPIVDAEVTTLGIPDLARRAQTCTKALEAKGYKPILYASSSIWTEMIRTEPRLRRLKVWEAQYPGRFSRWFPWLSAKRVRLRHGVTVVLWQWTDSYAVNGRRYDASALLAPIKSILIGD